MCVKIMDSRNLVSYNSKQIVWNYSKATQAYTKEISELEIIAKLWFSPQHFHLLRKLQQQLLRKLHKEQVQKLFQLHPNFVQFRLTWEQDIFNKLEFFKIKNKKNKIKKVKPRILAKIPRTQELTPYPNPEK